MMLHVSEVLDNIQFNKRIKKIYDDIDKKITRDKNFAAKSIAKRNQIKREIYCDSENIRIDIEEILLQDNEDPNNEDSLSNSYQVKDCFSKLDEIRKSLALDVVPLSLSFLQIGLLALRFITSLIFFFGGFTVAFLLIPLRFIHPLLRKLGIQNNYLPMDWLQWFLGIGLVWSCGIEIKVEGDEIFKNLKTSTLCMFSHASNLDGIIIQAISPITFKFIGKKSLFMIPIVGWVFHWGFGNIPIDRSNRSRAVKSLGYLANAISKWGRSVAISPEGTRSHSGHINCFKKGPFYLQEDTGKPITPALVVGAYELWPAGRTFTLPGKVLVRILPQFVPDKNKSRDENRLALRRIFIKAIHRDIPEDLCGEVDLSSGLWHYTFLLLVWLIFYNIFMIWKGYLVYFMVANGLSTLQMSGIFLLAMFCIEAIMYSTC